MKITIQTPDFTPQKTLIDFVEGNVSKLALFSDRIIECQICLKLENSDKKENKVCDLKLVIPGNDLFATRKSSTFEGAVQGAMEATRHQLERWKTLRNRKGQDSEIGI